MDQTHYQKLDQNLAEDIGKPNNDHRVLIIYVIFVCGIAFVCFACCQVFPIVIAVVRSYILYISVPYAAIAVV